MEDAFSLDELRDFTLAYGLEFENIKGETKREKVQEIVGYYYRLRLLDVFVGYLEVERPNHEWPSRDG